MSHLIASQKVIQHYLNALLTEETVESPAQATVLADSKKAELNRLLAEAVVTAAPDLVKAPVQSPPSVSETVLQPVVPKAAPPAPQVLPQEKPVIAVQTESVNRATPVTERLAEKVTAVTAVEKSYRQERFQALFFSVAGLKLAVPLTELGGIHEITTTTSLPGSPIWYQGVMLHRGQKIRVVDTARWVMPEQYTATLAAGLNYQYVIMLGASNWALTCELLIDTISLEPDAIKWREHEGKRPWMAGLIKEQKCVLVDVDQMINMLDRGLDVTAVTSIANKEL